MAKYAFVMMLNDAFEEFRFSSMLRERFIQLLTFSKDTLN